MTAILFMGQINKGYQYIFLAEPQYLLRTLHHDSFSGFADPPVEDVLSDRAKSPGTPLTLARQPLAFTDDDLGITTPCYIFNKDELKGILLF